MTAIDYLEIAMDMELKATEFYQKLHSMTDEFYYQDIINDLVQMEKTHYEMFKNMKNEIQDDTQFKAVDIDFNYPESRLMQLAKNSVNIDKMDMKDIFKIAQNIEQDTVEYYTILKNSISHQNSLKVLEKIIKEEQKHVSIMQDFVQNITKG
jgi:rubrerythrin